MTFPQRPRAVITGAGSGFGRAVSLALARRGGRLVISDIDADTLAETAERCRIAGAQAHAEPCDVRDPAQVERQAERADELFGGTDIVVNNAGVAVTGSVGEIPLEDWRWQLDINLWGVIHGCHSFVPRMKAQGSGWILNVASSAGLLAAPKMGPYNVTKAAVIALSETLYGELAGTGVKVTALCPTFFRTNIHKTARTPEADVSEATNKLVTEAKWSADQVAVVALDGLERGQLYVIPQADGRALWRAKRLLGQGFHGALGQVFKNGMLERLMGR